MLISLKLSTEVIHRLLITRHLSTGSAIKKKALSLFSRFIKVAGFLVGHVGDFFIVEPLSEKRSHTQGWNVEVNFFIISYGASPYPLNHISQREFILVDGNISN